MRGRPRILQPGWIHLSLVGIGIALLLGATVPYLDWFVATLALAETPAAALGTLQTWGVELFVETDAIGPGATQAARAGVVSILAAVIGVALHACNVRQQEVLDADA